jgi:hypothetical protein
MENWINAKELLGKKDNVKFKNHPIVKEVISDEKLMSIGGVDPKYFKKMLLSVLDGSYISRIPVEFKYGNLATYDEEFQLSVKFDRDYVEGEDGEEYACFPMAVQLSWYVSRKGKVEVIYKEFVVY